MGATCLKGNKVNLELCHLIIVPCCDTFPLRGMPMSNFSPAVILCFVPWISKVGYYRVLQQSLPQRMRASLLCRRSAWSCWVPTICLPRAPGNKSILVLCWNILCKHIYFAQCNFAQCTAFFSCLHFPALLIKSTQGDSANQLKLSQNTTASSSTEQLLQCSKTQVLSFTMKYHITQKVPLIA